MTIPREPRKMTTSLKKLDRWDTIRDRDRRAKHALELRGEQVDAESLARETARQMDGEALQLGAAMPALDLAHTRRGGQARLEQTNGVQVAGRI